MNPNYNPATVAAAENAVAEQTQRTVEQIEQNQIQRKTEPQRAAELEHTFRSIEKPGGGVSKLILSGTLKVRSVDGLDAEGDENRKMVVLASDDGSTLLEILTNDERFLKEGNSVAIEVRELATSLDPKKAGSGPAVTAENLAVGNPPFSTSTKPAPAITGTTGSKGTTDVSASRATEPTGKAPNPADPNLTGPSSDAGSQATKGEIIQGQQTGGKSSKGTGKGESERGAAREAGKSDAAIETKDGLDPKAPRK